jgi:hypothetical protein
MSSLSKLPNDFPRTSFWVEVSKIDNAICARLFSSARGFVSSITKKTGDKDEVVSDLINCSPMLADMPISIHEV